MRHRAFCFLSIVVLAAADQVSKFFVLKYLTGAGDVPVLGNFIVFRFVINKGAAFNILQNRRPLFIVVTLILLAVCLYFIGTGRLRRPLGDASLVLIAAGGLGNFLDRVFRGYVVDFIYPESIHFAIFNLADSFVVIGVAFLFLYVLAPGEKAGAGEGGK